MIRLTELLVVAIGLASSGMSVAQEERGTTSMKAAQLFGELVARDGEMSEEDERRLLEAGMSPDTLSHIKRIMGKTAVNGMERGRACLMVPLGEAIAPHEVGAFGWLLGLSDAQQKFLEEEYDNYMTLIESDWTPVVTPVRDRSADYLEFDEGPDSLEQLLRDVEKANRQLAQLDESLYTALIPGLTEHQIEQLPRLRMLRRRNTLAQMPANLAGARVDLLTAYFSSHESDEAGYPNSAPVEVILSEYQQRATSLVERHRREADTAQVEYEKHVQSRPDFSQMPTEVRVTLALAFSDETRRIHRRQMQLEESIHKLNESTLEQLVAELEPEPGERFRDWFLEKAYPHVYPYDERPESLIRDLIAVEDRPAKEVEALQAIRNDLMTQLEGINSRMEREYLQWRILTGERHGFHHGEYEEYQVEMQALLERRFRAMERALIAAAPFIHTAEAKNAAAVILEEIKARQMPSFPSGELGWPGPYDPPPQRPGRSSPVRTPGAGR